MNKLKIIRSIKECINYLENGHFDKYFTTLQVDRFIYELKSDKDLMYKYGITISIYIML